MKKDLRVIKTKKNLYESLIKLMSLKEFEYIKVSDICNEALISRSTFYSHFNTFLYFSLFVLHGPP